MPKVSVIMPSLNVAKFIKPCMDSVLGQSLQDIEVLAIDAGSTDSTWEILQEYAKKDSRVKLIQSEIRSYGYQVNLGISHAQGEYIGIVETDDILVNDAYKILYATASCLDVDYIKGHLEMFWSPTEEAIWKCEIPIFSTEESIFNKVIIPRDLPDLLVRDVFLWLGIYKREFLRDVRLNETPGAAFQDQGFLLQTFTKADRAVYIDKAIYCYRQDNSGSSICNTKGFQYLIKEYTLNESYIKSQNKEWNHIFYTRLFYQCMARFEMMAFFGTFWEEAVSEIDQLRCMIQSAIDKNKLDITKLPEERQEMLESFMKSSRDAYNFYVKYMAEQFERVKELKNVVNGRQIVIFGSGRVGKFLHVLLEGKYVDCVVCFCDNNQQLWNTTLQGKVILSPSEAIKVYPDALFVLTGRRFEQEMRAQLHELGVAEKNIYIYIAGVDPRLLRIK